MSNSINLLRGSKTKKFREEKYIRFLRVISILSLFFVGGVSAALFFLHANIPMPVVEKEEESQKKTFAQLQDTATKLLVTQKRIKDITTIIDKRELLDTVLGDFAQAIPENTDIASLALDGKNFSLTVISPSLSSLDMVVTGLVAMADDKKIFTKITLEGLSIDPKEDNYVVSLSGNLP